MGESESGMGHRTLDGLRWTFYFWIDKRGVMNLSYSCPWADMIRWFSTSTPHPRDCALKPFCSWKMGHLRPLFKKGRDCILSHQNRYYQSSIKRGLSFWNCDFIYVSRHQYWGMLSNISEKAHTVSAGWLDASLLWKPDYFPTTWFHKWKNSICFPAASHMAIIVAKKGWSR